MHKQITKLFLIIKRNSSIVVLLLFYLSLRLIFLSSLPIYSDEAVYLDWGWRETHSPGNLFYSLYDGKPPLMMWIFGIAASLLPNPLLAGRLVTVFVGSLTLLGIHKIAREFFNTKIATVSSLLYTVIPFFSFFDRQVLFESSVGAVGVWSCYLFLKLITRQQTSYGYLLGWLLGIGFFIKSSSIIFLWTFIILVTYLSLITYSKRFLAKITCIVLAMFGITDFLLFIQPQFWQHTYDERNTTHFLPISAVLHQPITHWIMNIVGNTEITFFYLTPLIFLFSIIGLLLFLRNKKDPIFLLGIWIIIGICFETLFLRDPIQRYLAPFLPLLVIACSYSSFHFIQKVRISLFITLIPLFGVPLFLTIIQIVSPLNYFQTMAQITQFSDKNNYVDGITSGYGLDEPISYLKHQIGDKPAFIGTAINSGTPETAVTIAFLKNNKVKTGYLDARILQVDLTKIDCIVSSVPLYFVSRDQQQAGLNKYFYKLKLFSNPYNHNTVGIYKIKEHCTGTSLPLSPSVD